MMETTRSSVFQQHTSGFVLDRSVVDSILEDDDDDDDEHMNKKDESSTNTSTSTSTNKKDESSIAGQLHVGTGRHATDAPCRRILEDNTKQDVPKSFIEPPMNHDATKSSLFRDASFSNMIMDDLMEDDDDDD
jgi:hypothetical protein